MFSYVSPRRARGEAISEAVEVAAVFGVPSTCCSLWNPKVNGISRIRQRTKYKCNASCNSMSVEGKQTIIKYRNVTLKAITLKRLEMLIKGAVDTTYYRLL
ncbi:hypothetical protein DPMN_143745 [Dreissena polymorpha]|uniref:Uncharacterized protein n=1 Tax=Dreissena polymorpha TaxID=45954 RepID=A0A9D4GJQ7_DREPO|nr:hypothetical protein DPMN_143745 [Dreissena polymorpha]